MLAVTSRENAQAQAFLPKVAMALQQGLPKVDIHSHIETAKEKGVAIALRDERDFTVFAAKAIELMEALRPTHFSAIIDFIEEGAVNDVVQYLENDTQKAEFYIRLACICGTNPHEIDPFEKEFGATAIRFSVKRNDFDKALYWLRLKKAGEEQYYKNAQIFFEKGRFISAVALLSNSQHKNIARLAVSALKQPAFFQESFCSSFWGDYEFLKNQALCYLKKPYPSSQVLIRLATLFAYETNLESTVHWLKEAGAKEAEYVKLAQIFFHKGRFKEGVFLLDCSNELSLDGFTHKLARALKKQPPSWTDFESLSNSDASIAAKAAFYCGFKEESCQLIKQRAVKRDEIDEFVGFADFAYSVQHEEIAFEHIDGIVKLMQKSCNSIDELLDKHPFSAKAAIRLCNSLKNKDQAFDLLKTMTEEILSQKTQSEEDRRDVENMLDAMAPLRVKDGVIQFDDCWLWILDCYRQLGKHEKVIALGAKSEGWLRLGGKTEDQQDLQAMIEGIIGLAEMATGKVEEGMKRLKLCLKYPLSEMNMCLLFKETNMSKAAYSELAESLFDQGKFHLGCLLIDFAKNPSLDGFGYQLRKVLKMSSACWENFQPLLSKEHASTVVKAAFYSELKQKVGALAEEINLNKEWVKNIVDSVCTINNLGIGKRVAKEVFALSSTAFLQQAAERIMKKIPDFSTDEIIKLSTCIQNPLDILWKAADVLIDKHRYGKPIKKRQLKKLLEAILSWRIEQPVYRLESGDWPHLIRAYAEISDYRSALDVAAKYEQWLNTMSISHKEPMMWCLIGLMELAEGDPDRAMDYLLPLLEMDSAQTMVINGLAILCLTHHKSLREFAMPGGLTSESIRAFADKRKEFICRS